MGRRQGGDDLHDAFISYSHAWDKAVAVAFQAELQGFARPWYRPRSLRIFRDETNLGASPDLWREIEAALSRSRWLVLMASPRAADSMWVRKEIRWWLKHRSRDTILIAWTDGELAWDASSGTFDWSATNALPREELAAVFDGRQPRWVDLRWLRSPGQVDGADPRLLECVAEFVAPLAGKSKDELIGDHIRQHRRTVRLVRMVIAALTSLLVIAAAGGITAYVQRNTAREQTLAAQSRQLVAEASSIQDSQPELARQLLVQAHRMSPTGQAQGALLASTSMARVIHTDGDSRSVSYSNRGAMVVTDDAVRLYDPATMAVLATLPVPKKHATAATFSPDGGLLAVGSRRGHTRLFDVADPRSPRLLGSRQATTDSIEGLFFHPRSPLLLVDADTSGAALDIRDPARPRVTDSDFDGAAAISPDARLIVTDGQDDTAHLWTLSDSGRLTRAGTVETPGIPPLGSRRNVTFSPDGHILAYGGDDNRVRLWDVANPGKPAVLADLNGQNLGIRSVAFSGQSTALATGAGDGSIHLWDVSDPMRPKPGSQLTGHTSWVNDLAFSPDGRSLASASADGAPLAADGTDSLNSTVRLWPVSGSSRSSAAATLSGSGSGPPAFSPDSTLMAAGMPTTLWALDDQDAPRKVSTLQTFNVGGQVVAFSADGATIASGVPVVTWDVSSPARPRSLTPTVKRSGGAEAVSFSPTRPVLAIGDFSEPVQLWDISRRDRPARLSALRGSDADGQGLAFSSDGHVLATVTDSGTVQLWDVTSPSKPSLRGVVKPTAGRVGALAFSPRGRTLLVGDSMGSVTAWDASDPRHPVRRGSSGRHTGSVEGLAYHRDGSLAASAGEDGGIRLWDVGNSARPLELTLLSGGGRFPSATLSFSPDGRFLAADSEGGVQLWDVDRTRILQRLCRDSAPITPSQWAQYLPGLDYDPPCA
ncbi:hypothetical protein A4E84_00055 [Streptomyces qaidamensis]|uniref:TIR domain-containing protein n=1 Tax=Streptomyces qaidamensis TaxID=1783515 RepID=A0A143BS66_9ACTN|nr:TIR domain-containing protein [Streptomyces qaidamensis]AMW08087.1 hypothetical protein A4E84_00055 [Streptomyces qaidamensis]